MLHHSLFTKFLIANGMETYKDEATRDVICIDFGFGTRSYADELKHIEELIEKETDEEKLKYLIATRDDVISKKDLYSKKSRDEIRYILYENGAPITYESVDKDTGEVISETIRYKMLYRNPSKAKVGMCMFVNEKLYDVAYNWLTMGLGEKMPMENAKIVEMSAYMTLTTSSVEGTMYLPVEDVLILKDQDSTYHTIADIVRSEEYQAFETIVDENGKRKNIPVTKHQCKVEREETDVVNTLWDGMALMEESVMPGWCNGMALMRNHFFKACAFKSRIQKFFYDYCVEHGIDYDTYEIEDMFGNKHLAKDIKMITTDNAIKWKKVVDIMGGTLPVAYEYWCEKVRDDGCLWGIVKTDHKSKLGDVQQMSYQMVNTLPCTKEDVFKIAECSAGYIETLKRDHEEYVRFLRRNANAINHYEMLIDLYNWNPEIVNSKLWRTDKSRTINNYVSRLKKGKITVPGDNLTVCGNPYALLLHTVGEDWEEDPTLKPEEGVIQVFAKRFEDGEYLCGIRSPHNSSNNLGYFHNVKHPLMDKYFDFSDNIMAVNCIHTDIQARMNGMDSMGRF